MKKLFSWFTKEEKKKPVDEKLLKQATDRFYISIGSKYNKKLLELSGSINDEPWLRLVEDLCRMYGDFFYEAGSKWELSFQANLEYIKFAFDQSGGTRIILHVYLDRIEFYRSLRGELTELKIKNHNQLIKILKNNEDLPLFRL